MKKVKIILIYGSGVALVAAGTVLKNKALAELGKQIMK